MAYAIGAPCIYYGDDLSAAVVPYLADDARFFVRALPGRDDPLGSPGGAARVGAVGADTEPVAGHPRIPGYVHTE